MRTRGGYRGRCACGFRVTSPGMAGMFTGAKRGSAIVTGDDRESLIAVLPVQLRSLMACCLHPDDRAATFVQEVADLSRRPPEQARRQAEAVVAALAAAEPQLVRPLRLPTEIADMCGSAPRCGGVVSATGMAAPLPAAEIKSALRRLPSWTGGEHALRRTIALPPENLDAVLEPVLARGHNLGHPPRSNGTRPVRQPPSCAHDPSMASPGRTSIWQQRSTS